MPGKVALVKALCADIYGVGCHTPSTTVGVKTIHKY